MSYRLDRREGIEQGVRRIAREQLDKALAEIDDADLDRHETVHQVRKRCKKLRALARFVRPALPEYKRINVTFRDAARQLSDIRDAHAVVETVDDLLAEYADSIDAEAFGGIRERLVERRDDTDAAERDIDRRIARFRDAIAGARAGIESWSLDRDGETAVAGGIRKTFRRARVAMAEADETPSTAAFHEWRKRVKYHWYHAKLLRNGWPRLVKPWAKEAHRLSDRLGDEHDLAVLHGIVLETPQRFGDRQTLEAFTGLIERRRAGLRAEAFALGRMLLFDKPGQMEARIAALLANWREAPSPLAALPPGDVER